MVLQGSALSLQEKSGFSALVQFSKLNIKFTLFAFHFIFYFCRCRIHHRMLSISLDIINQLCEVMSGRSSDQGAESMGLSPAQKDTFMTKTCGLYFLWSVYAYCIIKPKRPSLIQMEVTGVISHLKIRSQVVMTLLRLTRWLTSRVKGPFTETLYLQIISE